MTAVQINAMNTQLWQNIGTIADSEPLMKRLSKYVAKLVKEKEDPTLMSKEEFFAKIEQGERAYAQGKCHEIYPGEDLATYLRRRGYDL